MKVILACLKVVLVCHRKKILKKRLTKKKTILLVCHKNKKACQKKKTVLLTYHKKKMNIFKAKWNLILTSHIFTIKLVAVLICSEILSYRGVMELDPFLRASSITPYRFHVMV